MLSQKNLGLIDLKFKLEEFLFSNSLITPLASSNNSFSLLRSHKLTEALLLRSHSLAFLSSTDTENSRFQIQDNQGHFLMNPERILPQKLTRMWLPWQGINTRQHFLVSY
ncbi:hypothetical protein QYF36_007418 [Acer negundo]|nr:hypothetical protein QYF36_007418 [Acer negundo]